MSTFIINEEKSGEITSLKLSFKVTTTFTQPQQKNESGMTPTGSFMVAPLEIDLLGQDEDFVEEWGTLIAEVEKLAMRAYKQYFESKND